MLPKKFKYDIIGGSHPGQRFLLTVTGIDNSDPFCRSSGISSDENSRSIFPSVYGMKDDLLVLSMVFDDIIKKRNFLSPDSTQFVNFVKGNDKARYLYSKRLFSSSPAGICMRIYAYSSPFNQPRTSQF